MNQQQQTYSKDLRRKEWKLSRHRAADSSHREIFDWQTCMVKKDFNHYQKKKTKQTTLSSEKSPFYIPSTAH